jgi:transcriptional regulator with XRE-family HTH domain
MTNDRSSKLSPTAAGSLILTHLLYLCALFLLKLYVICLSGCSVFLIPSLSNELTPVLSPHKLFNRVELFEFSLLVKSTPGKEWRSMLLINGFRCFLHCIAGNMSKFIMNELYFTMDEMSSIKFIFFLLAKVNLLMIKKTLEKKSSKHKKTCGVFYNQRNYTRLHMEISTRKKNTVYFSFKIVYNFILAKKMKKLNPERLSMTKQIDCKAKQLGERIKQIRTKAGLTQEQFAASLGMGNANLSGIESGSKNPKLSFFFNLVKIYNVSLDYLFMGIGEPTIEQNNPGKNLQPKEVNDISTIHDFYWFMENSSMFRDTMMGQGAKFLYDNEHIIKKNIQKLKNKQPEDKPSDPNGKTQKN